MNLELTCLELTDFYNWLINVDLLYTGVYSNRLFTFNLHTGSVHAKDVNTFNSVKHTYDKAYNNAVGNLRDTFLSLVPKKELKFCLIEEYKTYNEGLEKSRKQVKEYCKGFEQWV